MKTGNNIRQFDLYATEITFSEVGDMLVTQKDSDTVSFLFSEVSEIYFSNTSLSGKTTPQQKSLSVYVEDNYLYLNGIDDLLIQQVVIYDLTGRKMFNIDRQDVSPVNISRLGKGVYIVKVGVSTCKFFKQ
jgi:hypothetical protein